MKSRGKWKHGKRKVEKVGRLEEARVLKGSECALCSRLTFDRSIRKSAS